MVFLGVYRAIYDYAPQGEGELAIVEGDLLFVLEKSTQEDWWRAKKKAQDEDGEEPEGLIPNNYVEPAEPIHSAKALYDYARQTDEELSFAEEALLDVYDTSDPDWTLVGSKGEYGFVPANYIEVDQTAAVAAPPMPVRPRVPDPEPAEPASPSSSGTPTQSPAVALAGIIAQKTGPSSASTTRVPISPPPAVLPTRTVQFTPEASDEEPSAPSLPRRPPSQQISSPPILQRDPPRSPSPVGVQASLPYNRHVNAYDEDSALQSPGGFHLYNIHEMIQHNGKNRKMPCTLGINIAKGLIMISPEKSRDGPQQEWTAEKLTHYSIESKHVFVELVRPSRSIDFHAGAKDTAHEIVSALGEIAGASRAGGLHEILSAASGHQQRMGQMLYEFMAQGDDEVTVAVGDEVIILDDKKSDEWWMVKRLKNGKEGVVPSSYVEITGTVPVASPTIDFMANRSEEGRKDKSKRRSRTEDGAEGSSGLSLPKRYSSLLPGGTERRGSQRSKRESKSAELSNNRDHKSKSGSTNSGQPDSSRVRTWTDRSGSFKVEAEYIGLREGKIHLHKLNGVKIAVPVQKMSLEDIEYVERIAGVSLDDDKPLSSLKRRSSQKAPSGTKAGISVEHPKRPEYDWFDFFLQCGVNPQICERYASAFAKDEMREEDMEGITPQLCRTLGVKEGDILRVMKFLDNKYSRQHTFGVSAGPSDGTNGGLFTGAGGALKNNTGRSRPTPPGQSNDVVDSKALQQGGEEKALPEGAEATPLTSAPKQVRRVSTGFDDNAWEPRQTKLSSTAASPVAGPSPVKGPPVAESVPKPLQRTPTGAAADLTDLMTPLQPTPAPTRAPSQPAPVLAPQTQAVPQVSAPVQAQQPQGATPSLFEQLAKANLQQPPIAGPQQSGAFIQPPRQRPQPPQQPSSLGGLAPPPQRAASVPNPPGFQPPPLQPQLTGYAPHVQTQIAPPGQSLQDLRQQQFLQSQQPMQNFGMPGQLLNGIQPQPTGFGQMQPQPQPQMLQAQATGYGQFGQPQFQGQPAPQQFVNGQVGASPFADPTPQQPFQLLQPQATGYTNGYQMQPQATGINAFLPPALTPQRTGALSANLQFGQAPPQLQQQPPPMPPMPQQQIPAPLVPQKTGPAPPVRFGMQPTANKLMPQPTGRRANLSHATPQNPFGF